MSAGDGASAPGASGELDDLQTRVARALLVVDLDQMVPAARDEARRLVANNEREFDGAALVETCLRHAPPASTSSVQRAMIALRRKDRACAVAKPENSSAPWRATRLPIDVALPQDICSSHVVLVLWLSPARGAGQPA